MVAPVHNIMLSLNANARSIQQRLTNSAQMKACASVCNCGSQMHGEQGAHLDTLCIPWRFHSNYREKERERTSEKLVVLPGHACNGGNACRTAANGANTLHCFAIHSCQHGWHKCNARNTLQMLTAHGALNWTILTILQAQAQRHVSSSHAVTLGGVTLSL